MSDISPELREKIAALNRRCREEQTRREEEKKNPALDDALQRSLDHLNKIAEQTREYGMLHRQWAMKQPQTIPCPMHHVAREINWDKSLRRSWENNEFTIVYRPCGKCQQAMAVIDKNKWLKRSGVPANLLHCSFDNFTLTTDEDKDNLELCKKYSRARAGFLILLSTLELLGNGKSHLEVALIREAGGGLFITAADVLNRIRGSFESRERIIDRCKQVKLLCVDEFGVTPGYHDELAIFHDILSHRHGEKMKTIVSGNFSNKQEFFDAIGKRMESRLRESGFKLLWFTGQSRRPEMKQEYFIDEDEQPEDPAAR